MQHQRHRRTYVAVAVIAAVLSIAAVGCGSDKSDGASSTTAKDASTTTTAPIKAPDKLTIAYQAIPNGDLIVKQQKLLEKALPDTKIEWKLFDSGGSVNEAVVAGNVDLGLAGSSPVSRGISNGIGYRVVWIHDVIGDAEALAVKPDIKSIKDLEGKTIATPFASTSHFSLLAALNNAGVDPSKVKIIDSEPDDIYAAWSRGDIDGAYVWNPNLAKIKASGGHVLITSADLAKKGQTTYDLGVASNKFLDAYPDVANLWAKAQDQAVQLIQDNPDDAAQIIGTELNISTDEAKAQLGDLIFVRAKEQAGPDYLGGKLAENLLAAAQFNKEQGEIDKVQPASTYDEAVDNAFAKHAGG